MLYRRPRNSGVAIITAIGLIALVAVALVGLANVMRAELRRTRDTAAEAQMRQLLLAGAEWATARLRAGDATGEHDVPLPDALDDATRLHVAFGSHAPDTKGARTRRVVIEVSVGEREVWQRLRFQRDQSGTWVLQRVRRGTSQDRSDQR